MRMRRRVAVVVVGAAALLAAAGIAYATIPDGNAVYTACMLKNVGTIRLIDPSGPSGSLLSHCTSFETQIQWNQKGQKGDVGPAGAPGANGVSPTVAQLSAGDSHCQTGGAAITDANGSTAYVCNGQDGKDFAGTFTSPNGQFTLTVADGGVQIAGPGASISLDTSGDVSIKGGNVETVAAGNETVTVGHDRTETVGHDELVQVGHDRTQTVDNNETVTIHGSRTETVDQDETVTIHGNRTETVDQDQNVTIGGNRTENVAKDESITIGGSRSESVGKDENVTVGGNRTETVGGTLGLRAAVDLRLDATLLGLNAGTACKPVARVGDPVNLSTGLIFMGSPDICVD
jgi:Gp5-like OB domain-containing protein